MHFTLSDAQKGVGSVIFAIWTLPGVSGLAFLSLLLLPMAFDPNRILIADDDEHPRQLLAHYLKSWGFQVTACRDGLEAAALLESDSAPSLALIDWMMPGLEGVEICRRVRNHPSRRHYIYIILLTGNDDAARGLEAGADDYIRKPYVLDELRARLSVGQRVINLERKLAEHIAMLRDALTQMAELTDSQPKA